MDIAQWLCYVYRILKVVFYIGLAFFTGLVLLLALQVICYVTQLYAELNDGERAKCVEKYSKTHPPDNVHFIPLHIHQIYFSVYNRPSRIPKIWEIAVDTWKIDHPDFEHTLWDSPKFDALLKKYYPELESVYHSYSHWVMRTDLARYVILHHLGGIYVDADIRSRQSLKPLYYKVAGQYETVVCGTQPFGIATDFIIARAGSPFLAHVLCGLKSSNRHYLLPYFTAMLSTGPLFLFLQYLTYENQDGVRVLKDTEILSYIRHIDGRTWHGWDGDALWWIFVRRKEFIALFICVLVAILVFKCYLKRKF